MNTRTITRLGTAAAVAGYFLRTEHGRRMGSRIGQSANSSFSRIRDSAMAGWSRLRSTLENQIGSLRGDAAQVGNEMESETERLARIRQVV